MIYLYGIKQDYEILSSKEKPMKITMVGLDVDGKKEKEYIFLIKLEEKSDVRKESRFMQFISYINELIDAEDVFRVRPFRLQSFQITTLARKISLVEWVPHTTTIKS